MQQYHRKCHRLKDGITLNDIQQDALYQVSSKWDDSDVLDGDDDEPHTTELDTTETGMSDFEKKFNDTTRAGDVMQFLRSNNGIRR